MGRDQVAWSGAQPDHHHLDTVVTALSAQADVVLIEGFRGAGYPTIVMGADRRGRWEPPPEAQVVATIPAADE